ncbi:cell division protein FtsK [Lentzea rhizosphaerae]|uniref:Cell division protein FtsK n=1 Tax=Lentzea rhizosphaerae TaxID=2041025 RepID=A0ABV8BP63_9PSEU
MTATTAPGGTPDERDATVLLFPTAARTDAAVPGTAVEPVGPVLDGELVDEDGTATVPALRQRAGQLVPQARQAAAVAATVGLPVARAAYKVWRGHGVWIGSMWRAATFAYYTERIDAARAQGDVVALAEWQDRLKDAKATRRQRVMTAPRAIIAGVTAALLVVVILAALLFLIGVTVWLWDGGWTWDEWWSFLAGTGNVLGIAFMVALQASVFAVPVAWLVGAYRAGARAATLPGWAMTAAQRQDTHTVVTPGGIGQALAHLGIPALNRAIKDGWTVEFATPPVRVNGKGYQAMFSLPLGVTPDMISDKRDVLARNLHRDPMEVWPNAAERAGFVDLWVADPGSSTKPAPECPLLTASRVDIFDGVPLGVSQRGDVIAPALVQANVVYGGMMGQGKSNAARVTMLGAALDPLAELWVFVFAGNGDFDAYQPRLARYERGTDPSVVDAALDSLRELYEEVGRREARLAELGAKKVTRGLAEKHTDLRPIVALFSECHELFGSAVGEEAAEFAVQTLRRARKTGIVLMFDTQSSRADAIPPKIVELVQINVCFAVKSWRSNDGFLGDGSFQAGIRATELRAGRDRGTALITGATAERFEILKWFYVPVDDETGWDAATEVIERAMTTVHPAVTTGSPKRPEVEAVQRDLLEDLADVLGHDTVPVADVPALLAKHAPDWPPYRKLNGKQLRALLASEYGLKVPSTGNRYPVDPVTIREALANRATADLDE